MNIRAWLAAARLRTLPLAISGVILGFVLPASLPHFKYDIALFCLITAISLQILSNFSNDYGDFLKGTDNNNRIGQPRALQQGLLKEVQLKRAIYIASLFSFISGMVLLYISDLTLAEFITFLTIGIAAIWAAVYYTLGKNAYGYKGWGDIAVAVFFGPAVVCGSGYLMTGYFSNWFLLLSITSATFSAAVLHINNMRDNENDVAYGKKTLAVRMGYQNSVKYLIIILTLGFVSSLIYIFENYKTNLNVLIFITLIPLFTLVRDVIKNKPSAIYNTLLKRMVLTALLHSILLFCIGMLD